MPGVYCTGRGRRTWSVQQQEQWPQRRQHCAVGQTLPSEIHDCHRRRSGHPTAWQRINSRLSAVSKYWLTVYQNVLTIQCCKAMTEQTLGRYRQQEPRHEHRVMNSKEIRSHWAESVTNNVLTAYHALQTPRMHLALCVYRVQLHLPEC